jgi:hypothetical protein
MLKVFYREGDSQLRLIEKGKQKVLARGASKHYFLSKEGNYVVYLGQSQNGFNGDLFIKHEGKEPKQFGSKVNLIHVSPTVDVIFFIDKYFINNNHSGSLYMLQDGIKKTCLGRNVSGAVMVVEKSYNQFRLIYEKRNKSRTSTLCVIDEKGTKHVLGNKFSDIRFYATNQDQIRTVAEVHRDKRIGKEVETFIFHDEELITIQTGFRHNDSLGAVTFNEKTESYRQRHFKQIFFEDDSDDIIFRFSNHTSSRYFVACEIAKRAKQNIILESLYEQDDSINHIVSFSRDQVDDILLLHYTLTSGSDFFFNHKLFGVDVEELFKHTGAVFGKNGLDYANIVNSVFMIKDTSEKIMFRHIQDTLMKLHGFKYRKELKAYLQRTYTAPLHEQYGKAMNFYSKFITTKEEENTLSDKMKQIEEELILQGKIPSKWMSEAEMFRLIKQEYPSARMHASPDWLNPQHLDVYIEDMKIAFEYQGAQHFLPIEFFGGDEGLKKRLKLDQRKKELCSKHGVELIEWMFHEPVTKIVLQQKIKTVAK